MKAAEIIWRDEQAESKIFGDIFYSRLGGLDESKHVFLGLNNLEQRFKETEDFQIGELGFGTGLNFLLSWKLFEEFAPALARLHFISTELFPMSAVDMRHALALWPEIVPYSEKLIESLPLLLEGPHRISFANGRITLTLLYGDAKESLSKLETFGPKFDCWFLDGFSPQKNPLMWGEELIGTVTNLTKKGGSFATYSAAGFIRRSFDQNGWLIEKVPGFGKKRESLRGSLASEKLAESDTAPWFSFKNIKYAKAKTAIVVGAGLAGCWSAYCLARKGIKVTLIEREAKIAAKASGNPAALAVPNLSLEKNARHRFYLTAFEYCRRELSALEAREGSFNRMQYGATQYLSPERVATLSSRFEELSIPEDLARREKDHCLFFEKACALNPELLCNSLLQQFPELINIELAEEAITLAYENQNWEVRNAKQELIEQAEVVVVANSYDALTFSQTSWLPLTKIRGELIIVEDPTPQKKLETALCGNSYILPLSENKFLAGASYNQVFLDPLPSLEIQTKLFQQAQNEFAIFSKNASILSARVAFRASTYDRMPYLGPVPDFDSSLANYREYKKGLRPETFPDCSYLTGLYVNLGHGSRGLVSTPLSAEIIASMVVQEFLPIEKDLLPALLPARWIIRELARGHEVLRQRNSEAKFTSPLAL